MITRPRALLQLYLDSYRGLPRKVWLLAAVMLINRSGAMVVAFLSVYLVNEYEYSLAQASLVMAAFGAGGVAGNYCGGLLNDRYGSWHIMLYTMIVAGGLHILLGYMTTFAGLCTVAFLVSLFADAFRPANRAAIAIYAPPERLTQSYGLQRMAVNLGLSIGPALGGVLIANYGFKTVFWGDGLTFLLAALAFYVLLPADETARPLVRETDTTLHGTAQAPPAHHQTWLLLMALANLCVMVCFFQFFSTLPVYLTEIGYDEATVGFLMTMSGVTIVLLEMPLVYSAEQRRYRPISVMVVGGSLIALAYALLPLTLGSVYLVAGFMVLLTIGEIYYMPFTATYVARWAPAARRGEYLGVLSASFSMAFIFTPLVCLNVAEHYGFVPSIYTGVAIGAVGVLLYPTLDRIRRRVTGPEPSVRRSPSST